MQLFVRICGERIDHSGFTAGPLCINEASRTGWLKFHYAYRGMDMQMEPGFVLGFFMPVAVWLLAWGVALGMACGMKRQTWHSLTLLDDSGQSFEQEKIRK